MAKPFNIQAPEQIAKEYAGNKQRIAQAAQMGLLDPTAAVLAGMFIDRMRGAQMQEAANTPSVAQEVMGGAPPAPTATPPMGAGSDPSVAPPMTPPMAPPMGAPPMGAPPMGAPPMGAPPMGMAEGGIVGLDIPDTMFDEDSNGGFDDGYAGGGLVAFGAGSPGQYVSDPQGMGDYFERMALEGVPGIGITSRKRSAAENAAAGGNPNSYHLIGAARDFVPPKGMTTSQLFQKLKSQFGGDYDVINEGDHVHVEPGPTLGRSVRGERATPAAATPERNINTASGRAMSLEDSMTAGRALTAGLPRTELERARGYALRDLDPAVQEKSRKEDMWTALAEMGFRMASSNSPFLLQAIGEAATATLPGVRASKRERKELKNDAVKTLMAVEDVDRKTALAGVEAGMNIYRSGVEAEQFEAKANLDREQLNLARDKLNAEIEAAKKKGIDVESFVFQMFIAGNPAQKAVAKEYLGARYPRAISGAGLSPDDIKRLGEGREGGGASDGPWTKYQPSGG